MASYTMSPDEIAGDKFNDLLRAKEFHSPSHVVDDSGCWMIPWEERPDGSLMLIALVADSTPADWFLTESRATGRDAHWRFLTPSNRDETLHNALLKDLPDRLRLSNIDFEMGAAWARFTFNADKVEFLFYPDDRPSDHCEDSLLVRCKMVKWDIEMDGKRYVELKK